MEFPQILKNERKKANLKQAELGAAVGVSKQAISVYESGEKSPKIETLVKLAQYFNMSIDELWGVEQKFKSNQDSKLVPDYQENYLLEMFRELSNDDKEKVIAITKTLHDMDKKSGGEKQIG